MTHEYMISTQSLLDGKLASYIHMLRMLCSHAVQYLPTGTRSNTVLTTGYRTLLDLPSVHVFSMCSNCRQISQSLYIGFLRMSLSGPAVMHAGSMRCTVSTSTTLKMTLVPTVARCLSEMNSTEAVRVGNFWQTCKQAWMFRCTLLRLHCILLIIPSNQPVKKATSPFIRH